MGGFVIGSEEEGVQREGGRISGADFKSCEELTEVEEPI